MLYRMLYRMLGGFEGFRALGGRLLAAGVLALRELWCFRGTLDPKPRRVWDETLSPKP